MCFRSATGACCRASRVRAGATHRLVVHRRGQAAAGELALVLVGVEPGLLHTDLAPVHVELLGDQHRQHGLDPLADLGVLRHDRDAIVGGDLDEGRENRLVGALAERGRGGLAPPHADQHAAARERADLQEAAARYARGGVVSRSLRGRRSNAPARRRTRRGRRTPRRHQQRTGPGCRRARRHGLPQLGRAMDGAADPVVGTAAADVAHRRVDLLVARIAGALHQPGRGHDLARLAVAALGHVELEPGPLHRVRAVGRQPLDRRDHGARRGRHGQYAGAHRRAVEVHGARTALRHAAAELRALQTDDVAQHPQQRHVRLDVHRTRLAVDREADPHARTLPARREPRTPSLAGVNRARRARGWRHCSAVGPGESRAGGGRTRPPAYFQVTSMAKKWSNTRRGGLLPCCVSGLRM